MTLDIIKYLESWLPKFKASNQELHNSIDRMYWRVNIDQFILLRIFLITSIFLIYYKFIIEKFKKYKMIQKKFLSKINLGFMLNISNKLVELTTKFSSDIFIEYNDKKVDAKSIMSILLLAASKGSELNLLIDGDDEQEASYLIEQLFNNYFEENE